MNFFKTSFQEEMIKLVDDEILYSELERRFSYRNSGNLLHRMKNTIKRLDVIRSNFSQFYGGQIWKQK